MHCFDSNGAIGSYDDDLHLIRVGASLTERPGTYLARMIFSDKRAELAVGEPPGQPESLEVKPGRALHAPAHSFAFRHHV